MMVSQNREEWVGDPIPISDSHARRPGPTDLVHVANLTVPLMVWEQVGDYVHLGQPPGAFLHAVLSNDLYRACASANEPCMMHLRDVVALVQNFCPGLSWGSPESVQSWLEARARFFGRFQS